jgi:hypothetical protein
MALGLSFIRIIIGIGIVLVVGVSDRSQDASHARTRASSPDGVGIDFRPGTVQYVVFTQNGGWRGVCLKGRVGSSVTTRQGGEGDEHYATESD